MTASVENIATETKGHSRRALLAGVLGGIGAWAASTVGRASPVRADGETIHVGDIIATAASTTTIQNSSTADTVLVANNTLGGIGVAGFSGSGYGVEGVSGSNAGVRGVGGKGVSGSSSAGHGIHGESDTGWAGYFDGRVFTNTYLEMPEIANPPLPAPIGRGCSSATTARVIPSCA